MDELKTKILLVEDDKNLGFVTKDNLSLSGYEVTLCEDGETAWKTFNKNNFDLCILDVMLPKKDGFTLAEDIRKVNDLVPIIFLTAKSMNEDKLKGFKLGGDDYLTKPFNMEELVERIKALLRRRQTKSNISNQFTVGNYQFDYPRLNLSINGETQHLTQKEADLLKYFCLHLDKTLKREEILNTIWGDDDYFMGRSMDVFISKLRKYLKDDPRIEIQNLHGIGFKMIVHEE